MKVHRFNRMAFEEISSHNYGVLIVGIISIASIVIALTGCLWCRKKWTKFQEQQRERSIENRPGEAEFTSFPGISNTQLTSVNTVSTILDEIVFEPLPEIRSRNLQAIVQNIHPARFSGISGKISLQDWFDGHRENFPRNQLKYLREVGSAWYGQAVEGEAFNIFSTKEKRRIVVKILRVDATVMEYMQFLHEARPFRDLHHPNLLSLIGQCLEVHPFLLLVEHCEYDLKNYLIQQRKTPEEFLKDGFLLSVACNIASGLQHMHEHGYIHCDVAAHSCVITADLIVKVGDYGTAIFAHKSDYYCLGDIAFPLRWCAPEVLHCTDSIIEAKDISREANVWSIGVVLWELLEFGKLPFMDYTDDEVVQKVIIDSTLKLEQPKTPCVHKDMIFNIMQLCWLPASHRPSMQKISALLAYLFDNKDAVSESAVFESRWNSLQPVFSNPNSLPSSSCTSSPYRFETDFLKGDCAYLTDSDSILSNEFSPRPYGDKSPSTDSLSTYYDGDFRREISSSLRNLRGSIDDSTNASSTTEEVDGEPSRLLDSSEESDMQATITEVIKDLDTVLAAEITSSDSSKCTTPDKSSLEVPSTSSPEEISSDISGIGKLNTHGNGEKVKCYEGGLLTEISPSLKNLRGSFDDLTNASSTTEEFDGEPSKPLDSSKESDMQATITEVVKDLDTVLAAEITSSESSKCTTPDKSSLEVLSTSAPEENSSDVSGIVKLNTHVNDETVKYVDN